MSTNVAVPAREQESSVQAQALLAALTEVAARAGHDMVGPLNQAGSLLALFIKRYKGRLDGEADQLLEFLQSSATRMEGVIEGLRNYCEAVAHSPVATVCDLNRAVSTAKENLEKQIAESGATIECEPLPAAVADEALVSTVFQELLGNAIKFREAGQSPRIHITARREGPMVAITIQDDGIGIDPEHCQAIFVPFKRLNGREYPGAGLGLAAVKAIIAMHGGYMRLVPEAANGAGTAIEFTLPAA